MHKLVLRGHMPSHPRVQRAIPWLMLLAATACDGYISVDGRVYARTAGDTLQPSEAFIDRDPPDTTGLVPLPGAAVWVFHSPKDTASPSPHPLWVDWDSTSVSGSFHTGSTTAPTRFTALLRVRRTGYQGVDALFVHDTSRHRAVVVLTPERRPH
jgi:hypothetical protein